MDLVAITRRRQRPLLAAVAAAIVSVTAIGLSLGGAPGDHTGRDSGAPPTMTTSSGQAPDEISPLTLERDLYRVLDARGLADFFMLKVEADTKTATFWDSSNQPPSAALQNIATNAGYRLISRDLPPADTWSQADEYALSSAADQVRARFDQTPASGFTALKIEVPLKTLIVWRTTPNETVDDDELRAIASADGIVLELRTATISKTDAERLGRQLQQSTGQGGSFTVLGAYSTGSGPVVTVTGDLDAAKAELGNRPGVFSVQLSGVTDAPGVRHNVN